MRDRLEEIWRDGVGTFWIEGLKAIHLVHVKREFQNILDDIRSVFLVA